MKKKVALSWSGGKDCCMALDRLVKEGHEVVCLLTTIPAETGRTFGHGEKAQRIREQADALGLPAEFIVTSYERYTLDFAEKLRVIRVLYGADAVAFGDLYDEEHRAWGEGVARQAGLEALYPLWMDKGKQVKEALLRFVTSGYRAFVIRVKDGVLPEHWLGRELDRSFYEDILQTEADPMGENGEYHTFVTDGPLFRRSVPFVPGPVVQMETTKRLEHEGAF